MERVDRRQWISKLPSSAWHQPISELSIPGTHDSCTYSLKRGSEVGPDQPPAIRRFARTFPWLANRILYRWSYTQYRNALEQLENGIRYFDIRLVGKGEGSVRELVVLHCLYGEPVANFLRAVNDFLLAYPREFVILDFQHVYQFSHEDHAAMLQLITDLFGSRICPTPVSCVDVSPAYLWRNQLQVIVVYPLAVPELFWPRNLCLSPWPNTTSSAQLKRFLTAGLSGRRSEQLFVSQGVFTPSLATILFNLTSDLERSCALRCNRTVFQWLEEASNRPRPNILIVDFLLSRPDTEHIVDKLIALNSIESSKIITKLNYNNLIQDYFS